MTAIEILASITAVSILVKVVIYVVNPKLPLKAAETILKNKAVTTTIYLILAVIVGYYVFASLNIVQVTAVMLLAAILFGLSFIPLLNSETMLKIVQEMPGSRVEMLHKNWLVILIWVAIAIWTLYTVFIFS